MKIIIVVFTLILSFAANCQNELPVKDGKVVYEFIDTTVKGSSDQLNDKAKIWFANAFRDSKEVLQYQSENSLIGKGNFDFNQAMVPFLVRFSVRVDCKDNKYRVQFYDITYREGTRGAVKDIEGLNEKRGRDKLKGNIDQHFKYIISSISKTMSGNDNDF